MSRATGWVRAQLTSLETAEKAVLAEIEETRAAWNGEILEVQGAILRVSQEIDENRAEQLRLSQELATLIEERDSITSVGLTNEFIAERTGSDDYRRLLGLPALIQRDFKMLSKLVREQNEDLVKHPGQEHANPVINRHVINRIVLYIDDLDRCPDQHVVEVLQAVHLLLAFDLFVVVVAVDARWLNHALVAHYPALVNDNGEGGQPTADDYLEKIFQIPFWIEPLVDAAKCRIVGGLLRPQLAGGGDGGGDLQPAGAPLKVAESQAAILDSIEDRTEPLSLNASDLSVSPEELEFLDSLAPLLGGTPRGIKRFVNLYQLLRIIHRVDPTEPQLDPTDEELLAFVLAVGDGLPRLAELLFAKLSESLTDGENGPIQGQCLSGALAGLELVPLREQQARLEEWLATRPSIQAVTCSRLAPIARLAERFLFRVGGRTVVDSSGSE